MSPKWWIKLSRDEQLVYLKAHPRSKLKAKRASTKRKSATPAAAEPVADADVLKENSIPEPMPLQNKKASIEAVGKHQEAVKSALTDAVDAEIKAVPERVKNMPAKELSKVGKLIKTGVEKESGKHLIAAAGIMLGKAALITVGLGLAASVGVVPSVYMLGLYSYGRTLNNWVDSPLRKMVEDFTTGVYDSIREGLQDSGKLRDNLVANEPDTTIQAKTDRESASAPNHISDVVKSLASLSKRNYATVIEQSSDSKVAWVKVNSLLGTLYDIEFDLRRLNNLRVKFRLSGDSGYLAKCLSSIRELSVARKQIQDTLLLIAAKQTDESTLEVARGFGKALASKEIFRTYIFSDSQIVPCWLINAENVRATNSLIPRVYCYVACALPLRVAVSMDSFATPSEMQTYDKKIRPNVILAEYGLL